MSAEYSQLPISSSASSHTRVDDPPPAYPPTRPSLDTDDDEEYASDVSYRDHLADEPFREKAHAGGPDDRDKRWDEEGVMEDGEEGEGYAIEPRRLRPRKKSRKVLAILIGIVAFAAVIGGLAATGYSAPSFLSKNGNRHITMDHVFNGTFGVRAERLDWVKEAPDGTFSRISSGNIVLSHVRNMSHSETLLDTSLVLDLQGNRLRWQTWALSADMQYVLFKTDHVKQWRHSSHGNYWIHRLSDHTTFPLSGPSTPPKLTIVKWAPVGHALAYVLDNDMYVVSSDEMERGKDGRAVRVTDDGSAVVFNGVPDWVYEEEVFETDSALWWSPNGETIAYTRSDEAAVRDYKLQYYNPTDDAFEVNQYPTELDMKYPKPGTPNPLVTVHTFSLSSYLSGTSLSSSKQALHWPGEMSQDQRIIVEVGWVADDALMVKEIDRAARVGKVVVFEHGEAQGKVVRVLGEEGEEGDQGWIDHGQNVVPVKGSVSGYLDLIPNKQGFNHIALFSPITAAEPVWLTDGEWEVTSIAGFDEEHDIVYFITANPSIDRHLQATTLPSSEEEMEGYASESVAMTDMSAPGYHSADFSPGGGYYVLAYHGPEVPWQRVKAASEDKADVDTLLEGNAQLNATLAEFMRPIMSRSTINIDGNDLNMLEILPPNIDTSGRKKYPVLMRVYGGPGSQMVSNTFSRDWHTFLACERKYIVVIVDGRGTGFKGRGMRNPVRDELGRWEVADQVAVAREVSKRVYVDREKIGIWGWSYGGYMTCKTVEADSGVFTLAMAVAPVTNWLYYDSVYTERYMSTPSANPQGYITSAVNNVTAFGNVDFLLAHGTGDDNVHFAHSAALLDKFTQRQVRGWRFRMFTDSDHNIGKRGAYRELFEWMTAFLDEKWGRGGRVRHA